MTDSSHRLQHRGFIRRCAYDHPNMTFFGIAYVLALVIWATQDGRNLWLAFVSVLAVTVFLLVRHIECRIRRRREH